jgi:hypothetical protein
MGDRTKVVLTMPTVHVTTAKKLLKDSDYEINLGQLTEIEFSEVNWGTLPFLSELRKAGIPYNSHWDNGCEYTAGEEMCRFTSEGEIELLEVYDESKNPDLDTLIGYIDNPNLLRSYILNYKDSVSSLPWDNQEAYSKIYLTKQLIAGK